MRRLGFPFGCALSACVLTLCIAPTATLGAPERLLWETPWYGEGDLESTNDVATAGRSAIAVGLSDTLSSEGEFGVRAFDVRTGEFLWEDDQGLEGSCEAVGVATARRTAVVVGSLSTSSTEGVEETVAVRAHDVRTGALVWHDHTVPGRGAAIAARGGTAVAAAAAESGVRAYDVATGGLRWEVTTAPQTFVADDVALSRRVAVLAGRTFPALDDHDWAVRAYDAQTGSFLWGHDHGMTMGFDFAGDVAIDRRVAVVVGRTTDGEGIVHFTVRAFDESSGVLLWEDLPDPSAGPRSATAVALGRGVAVVTGSRTGGGLVVLTYDLATGALLWDDALAGSGHGVDVAVRGRKALVLEYASVLRAYELSSGAPLWQEDVGANDPTAIALSGGKAIVGGTTWGDDYGYQVVSAFRLGP
jgi:outer membrane protein assembly factor BamB